MALFYPPQWLPSTTTKIQEKTRKNNTEHLREEQWYWKSDFDIAFYGGKLERRRISKYQRWTFYICECIED